MLKQINKELVETIPTHLLYGAGDDRPIKGYDLIPELFSNIYLCAKKKSGKTSVIWTLIKKCVSRDTKIIAFVSTLNKDESWLAIKDYCNKKLIYFEGHTSLKDDDGVDILEEFVKSQEAGTEELSSNSSQSSHSSHKSPKKSLCKFDEDFEEVKKEKPSKFKSPEWLILIDDLSSELHATSINALLKKNRHLKSKVIISSQYLNDLSPMARKQMDFILLFKGHPLNKLQEIYHDADVSVPFETFVKAYKLATEDQFSFLYIDTRNDKFRKNFNKEIII